MNKVYFPIVIAVAVAVGLLLGSKLNPSSENAFLSKNANKNKLNKLIDFIEKEKEEEKEASTDVLYAFLKPIHIIV